MQCRDVSENLDSFDTMIPNNHVIEDKIDDINSRPQLRLSRLLDKAIVKFSYTKSVASESPEKCETGRSVTGRNGKRWKSRSPSFSHCQDQGKRSGGGPRGEIPETVGNLQTYGH